ncbi:MAG: ABC transporter substrate-binding protein [Lachnospiraceae bacterium]|nr:ABC transporter substrate-binding protein [Lachnospiraceae bacterium]
MRKTLKKVAALGLAVAMVAGVVGCGGSGSSADAVKIGLATPLTGASAQDGKAIQNGVNLAVKMKNEAGGINGKTVEVVAEDDKGDSSEAATVANKLAQDDSILAVIGHFNSSCTLAGAPIYNNAGVVEISPGSSSAAVTDAGDYTFRVITTDAVQGQYLADWCVNDLGYKNVAILYENDDYGLGLADVAEEETGKLGAKTVVKEAYEVGQTDFSTVLTKVAASDAEVLIIGGLYNETALIAKQMADNGLGDMQIMGVDAIYSGALIDLGGEAVDGIKLTAYFSENSDNAKSQEFVTAYQEEYGEVPGTYAAYAYDAALVVMDAIENAGEDRVAIRDYMSKIEGFEGSTGTATFDKNGDVIKAPLRMEIQDGKYTIVEK